MKIKNRIKRTIASGILCFTLVSNYFVAFATDNIDVETPIEITTIEETTEIPTVEENETIITEEEENAITTEEDVINEDAAIDETLDEIEEEQVEVSADTIEEENEILEEEKKNENPSFSYSDSKDGINISISAPEGVFPEGTYVNVSVLGDDSAKVIAEQTIDSENIKQVKAVDITFYDKDGNEIQPNGDVNVNISFSAIEGDNFTVLHEHNGTVESIDANVDADSASFTSSEFSVFIIVGTGEDDGEDQREVATYKFYVFDSDADDWIPFAGHEEQYIKGGDTLYNPGTPNIDPAKHEKFIGWELEDGTPAPFGTIDSVTANQEIKVYANITTTYYVTFIGVEDDVVQVKEVPGTQGESAYTTVNDIPYSIQRSTQAFKGWSTVKDDESTLITNNSIDASQTSEVYACIIDAYWIHFDENDDTYDTEGHKISSGGASYVGPVAISQTKTPAEVVSTIPESNRHGYDFLGWYYGTKNADNTVTLGDPFDWNSLMTEDVTVYAKWQAHTDTELTINIWKQNINGTGYDYVANASHVYEGVTGANIVCYEDYFYMSDPEGNYSYYSSSDVDLKGFQFSSAEIVDGSGNTVDTLSAKGDTVINVFYDRKMYTLTFQNRVGNRWSTVYTINALYEQNISSHFPIKVGTTTYNNFWQVQGNPETYVHDLLVGKIDIMPAENITFHRYTTQGRTFNATWNYYVETLEGTPSDTVYDNIDFSLRNAIVLSVTSDMQSTEAEEFMNIRGFTKYKANPTYVNGVQNIIEGRPINLYYLRNRYTLTFMDGDTSLKTIGQIPYEQSLSSYESQAPAMDEDKDGMRFIGWYLDKSGTIPFDWNSTMPIDGQIVYAKYAPIRFRVTLDPDGGTIDTTKQAITFMEDYNGKLDANSLTLNISKEDWELVGWFYKDGPKAGQAYDFDKITETTTDYQYDESKGYFVGTVNIIAGWRYPGLVYIRYDAGENGTDAPTSDKYGYAYNSTVVVDRPSTPNQGYNFIGWSLDNNIYYPNGSFSINKDLVETIDGKNYITLVAKYEKTGGTGSTEVTDINYHSNDDNNITYTVEDIKVNKAIDAATLEEAFGTGYSRNGYKFLGWSKESGENNEVWLEAGTAYTIGADNDGVNDLYAVWQPAVHVTYTDGVEDEVIFIDEVYEAFIGDNTPAFSKDTSTLERTGYKFTGWTPEIVDTVSADATYTAEWEEDYSVTKTMKYTVQHKIGNEVKDTNDFTEEIWINETNEVIEIQANSITPKEYKGYKFDTITPNVAVGDTVDNNTIITLTYIKNEEDTQDVTYTVNHIINNEVKDTKTVTQQVWINDPAKATIEEGDLEPNEYKGYKFDYQDPEVSEGETVDSETVINIYYTKNEEDTQKVTYTVNHIVEGEIKDTKTVEKNIWVLDPAKIEIETGDLAIKEYKGYMFDSQDPEDISEGDIVDTDTTINIYYVKNEEDTQTVEYTVKHIVNGEVKATNTISKDIWINDPSVIAVTSDSITPNEYEGYTYSKTINATTEEEVSAEQEVNSGTVIHILYEPRDIRVRYEYRFAKEDEKPSTLPELPDPFFVKYGEELELIDLPVIDRYTLSDWAIEKDETLMTMSRRSISIPSYNIVVYTIITKKSEPAPPPTPTPDPKPEPTTIDDTPTPTASTPIQNNIVLGATRENEKQVLGARRAITEDVNSLTKRYSIVIICICLIGLIIIVSISRKRKS